MTTFLDEQAITAWAESRLADLLAEQFGGPASVTLDGDPDPVEVGVARELHTRALRKRQEYETERDRCALAQHPEAVEQILGVAS